MPNLVVIFGPPASGKAAIGHELAALTVYKFFHNHLTADPVAALFGWGTARFGRMVERIRETLLREAVTDPSVTGVIFTFVWSLDLPEDTAHMERLAKLFVDSGGHVHFVELLASLETRIAREGSAFRVGLKPAQRNVEAARARQVYIDTKYRMNTTGELPLKYPHLIIDTEQMSTAEAAMQIKSELSL